MGTDCPVCAATAAGGRIRLTEDRAQRIERLLRKERHEVLVSRREAIDMEEVEAAGGFNEAIREIDILLEEIARTQTEKGWRPCHEPERPHP